MTSSKGHINLSPQLKWIAGFTSHFIFVKETLFKAIEVLRAFLKFKDGWEYLIYIFFFFQVSKHSNIYWSFPEFFARWFTQFALQQILTNVIVSITKTNIMRPFSLVSNNYDESEFSFSFPYVNERENKMAQDKLCFFFIRS